MDQHVLLRLIESIYEAALDPELWSGFLEQFSEVLHGEATALLACDMQTRGSSINKTARLDDAYEREYNEYYAERNIWIKRGASLMRPGTAIIGEMICSDRELQSSEYYNGYVRRSGLYHIIGGTITNDSRSAALISTCRPRRRGPFERAEMQLVETLIPHMRRALQIHRRTVTLEGERDVAAGVLDRIPNGCLLIDGHCRVLLMNRIAQRIVDQHDGLIISRRSLTAWDRRDSRKMEVLMRKTVQGELEDAGGTMMVARPSMKRSYSILICPVRNNTLRTGIQCAAAIIFIADPECEPPEWETDAKRLFGLTPAEARLALILLEGHGLTYAAEKLKITLNTAKTQAKAIYGKTKTKRQAELIRLILSSCAFFQRQ